MQTLSESGLSTVVKSLNVDEECWKISARDANRLQADAVGVEDGSEVTIRRYGGHRNTTKMGFSAGTVSNYYYYFCKNSFLTYPRSTVLF